MDLTMPELNGLDAARLISAAGSPSKVVILTASEEDTDLLGAIKSGAQGYLLRNVSSAELFHQVDAAAAGEPALTPGLALLGEFAKPTAAPAPKTVPTGHAHRA